MSAEIAALRLFARSCGGVALLLERMSRAGIDVTLTP